MVGSGTSRNIWGKYPPNWTSDPSGVPGPDSPSPLTGNAWSSPGPVSEAVEGPFAAAGDVANKAASAPAVASRRNLRMGLPFVDTLQLRYTGRDVEVPARRLGRTRARSAETRRCCSMQPTRTGADTMDLALDTREAVEDAAGKWWLFLVGGIAWLVFALIVFQGNYKTVYAVSILFGIVAIAAGLTEFMSLGFWTSGWKIVHGILGTLFVIAGVWALVHPHNAFATLAALMGLFLLFKGIYDIMVSFIAKEQLEIWWLQLVLGILEVFLAFW